MFKEIIVYKDCGFELKINGYTIYSKFIKDKDENTRARKIFYPNSKCMWNILASSNLNAPLFDIKFKIRQESNTIGIGEHLITIDYQDKNLINTGYGICPEILLGPEYFKVKSVACPEVGTDSGTLFVLGSRLNDNSATCFIGDIKTYKKLLRTINYLNETPAIKIIFNHLQFCTFGY